MLQYAITYLANGERAELCLSAWDRDAAMSAFWGLMRRVGAAIELCSVDEVL